MFEEVKHKWHSGVCLVGINHSTQGVVLMCSQSYMLSLQMLTAYILSLQMLTFYILSLQTL